MMLTAAGGRGRPARRLPARPARLRRQAGQPEDHGGQGQGAAGPRPGRSARGPQADRARPAADRRAGPRVTCDGAPVDLTRRELDVLLALAEHPGWVYTRDQLLSTRVGLRPVGETRLVDMQVANLRRKLGEAAALVETVRGVGYRLRAGA